MPELWIPGEPVGKGRPRLSTIGGSARAFTPEATRREEHRIAGLWWHDMFPKGVPLYVSLRMFMQRPGSHFKKKQGGLSAEGLRTPYPTKRPDMDNVVKLVLDALNGVAYQDDSQIVVIKAYRLWAFGHTEPGIKLSVMPVSGPDVSVVTP